MVICLGWGVDLHMAQLMPLPLTISCSSKSRLVLPFWYRLTQVVPDKGLLNGCSSSHKCLINTLVFIHQILLHAGLYSPWENYLIVGTCNYVAVIIDHVRSRWRNVRTTAKQVAMVSPCVAKKDNHWVKKCMEYEVESSKPRGRPKKTWREVVQKHCQVCKLNRM